MTTTIFITGADKGLGLSLASKSAQRGFLVFAGLYAWADHLQELADRFPDQIHIVPLDVTDIGSVRRAAQVVTEQTEALDILINNAGIYPHQFAVTLEETDFTDPAIFDMLDVNSLGPLRVTQQFLPLLEKSQSKRIINISSEAGSIADCPRDGEYIYCMSKAALNMQSMILQRALRGRGFKVLAIHPGWMRTDMGGPDANLHPDQSAEAIMTLALKDWQLDDPIYMDYAGKLLPW
jgi:NAD(P)-dependent dehydrogenase (short-subunit alcohol dehydrogenase family)